MPPASVRDSGTAGSPAAREARRRGLEVSEMFADSSGNGAVRLVLHPGADSDAVLDAARRAGRVLEFAFARRRLSEVFREAVRG